MPHTKRYVVDSDVFITAKNRYYAFNICPGFWRSVIACHRDGRVYSIDRVKSELLAGRKTEDLVLWAKDDVPDGFFCSVDGEQVTEKYTEIMQWVQRSPRVLDSAKAKFAAGADGWLVAFAAVDGAIVVTNEQPAPESRRDIKLPDVCSHFGVKYLDTFDMLRELSVQFTWAGAAK